MCRDTVAGASACAVINLQDLLKPVRDSGNAPGSGCKMDI